MSTVSRRTAARRKKGFTLVELLVVISIIAILAAILFPSLAQAQKQAKGAVCLNQLKQIGFALGFYESAYNDALPTTAGLSNNPGLQIPVAWYAKNSQPNYWGETVVPVPDKGSTSGSVGKQLVDQLAPWIRPGDGWFCPLIRQDLEAHLIPPADNDADANGLGGYWTYKRIRTNYLFNQYTVHIGSNDSSGNPIVGDPQPPGIVHGGRQVSTAIDTSTAVTVWDDPCCTTPVLESWWSLPHNNNTGINVAYADSHAAFVPVLHPSTDYDTSGNLLNPIPTGGGNAWCCSGILEVGWDRASLTSTNTTTNGQ